MKAALLLLSIFLVTTLQAVAQCSMCRTTLENNLSNGDPGIAAGINTGILYLLSMPYLAALVIGYLWYRNVKNARQELRKRSVAR